MAHNSRLTPHDVIYILQCPDTDTVVAFRLGVSRQTVNNIRNGRNYKNVAPQLPRREVATYNKEGPLCTICNFWDGYGCSFKLPESLKDLRFAQECSMYAVFHLEDCDGQLCEVPRATRTGRDG